MISHFFNQYPYQCFIVELSDGLKAYSKLWEDEEPLVLFNNDNDEFFTKNTLLAALTDLHIGEWRRSYSTKLFGYQVLDGTQWELEFEYFNGHKAVRLMEITHTHITSKSFRCYLVLLIVRWTRMIEFDILTKYISMIQSDSIGEWIIDKEYKEIILQGGNV